MRTPDSGLTRGRLKAIGRGPCIEGKSKIENLAKKTVREGKGTEWLLGQNSKNNFK